MSNNDNQKNLSTLVEDIDALFLKGHCPSDDALSKLGMEVAAAVRRSLGRPLEEKRDPTLRMSNIGKPDRQLWYEIHEKLEGEELGANTLRKFLMGDLWEAILLFLAEQAGHRVEQRQAKVEVNDIDGHIDAIIDDVVVDVKSASTYAFKKFKYGTLQEDDPFGYYDQLGGYSHAFGLPGAWLAVDKQTGALALLEVPKEDLEALNIPERVEHLKTVVASPEAPKRCYEAIPEGKSGNMKLPVGCSYCSYKKTCWSDANNGIGLRVFLYSSGPIHLTEVVNEPRVPEITF